MGWSQARSGASIHAALLCLGLTACGLTTRDPGPVESDPNDPCIAHAPSAGAPENCAYPIAKAAEPPELASTASLNQASCRYRLGEPRDLPLSGEYAFSFDVNGDRVGDVFFWANGLRLAVSRVENGVLSYEAVDCDALKAIPYGRVFVRDLNGDALPDLVVGVRSLATAEAVSMPDVAFAGFVNLPSGFVEVFRHEWPEGSGKTTLVDLAVADFDGDGACLSDVAFGYDRVFAPANDGADLDVEIGVLVSLNNGSWPNFGRREHIWTNSNEASRAWITGSLAVGLEPVEPALFLVQSFLGSADPGPGTVVPGIRARWEKNRFSEQELELEAPPDPLTYATGGPFDAWILPFAGGAEALALLHMHDLVFYDFGDSTTNPPPILLSLPTLGEHGRGREIGGGPQVSRAFMIDVEGDGDLDFVEYASFGVREEGLPMEPPTMAIHRNHEGERFADGMEFEVRNRGSSAESPFVAVGAAKGALIVSNSVDGLGPATLQALECAPE